MNYKIEEKSTPPTRVVCTVKPIPFSDLRKEAIKIFGLEKDHLDSALIAQLHAAELHPTTPVTVSYPMKKHITLDEKVYKVDVIQRSNVVFTHHFGSYDSLEQSFQLLLDYMKPKSVNSKSEITQISWILLQKFLK